MNKKHLIWLLVAGIVFGIVVHLYNKARFAAHSRAVVTQSSEQEQMKQSESEANSLSDANKNTEEEKQKLSQQAQEQLQDLTNQIQQNDKDSFLYYKRAMLYYSTQQYAQAIADLNIAIKLSPDSANSYYLLGMSNAANLDYKTAILAYNSALKIKPKEPKIYNSRALALVEDGQMQAALADYMEAIKLNPEYAQAHYNLATLYERQKQYPESKAEYDLAIKYFNVVPASTPASAAAPATATGNTVPANAVAPATATGDAVVTEGNTNNTGTTPSYQPIASQVDTSELLDAYYRRAIVYLAMGDYNSGLADISYVIEHDPKSVKAYKLRAAIYGKLGNAAASMSDESKAQDLSISNMMQ